MRKRIEAYIKDWEEKCYTNGIPDEVPNEIKSKVPSYKRIAIAILNNDVTLKSLGLTGKKSVYYSILKKIEINERNKSNI
jgi:predicted phosphoadenosine phosphosulfate sulfurtransferase